MDAVKKAKTRLRSFPALLNDCRNEGQIYAKCVLKLEDVKKDDCSIEFKQFINCVKISSKKRNFKF